MREQHLAAVQAHLARIRTPRDALAPEVTADIRRLTEALGDDEDLDAGFALGWLHWYRYSALPEGQDRDELRAALRAFVGCFVAGAEPLPEPLLPVLADVAEPVAIAMTQQGLQTRGPDGLETAALVWQRIVAAASPDDAARARYIGGWGVALQMLAERTGSAGLLDEAVETLSLAVTVALSRGGDVPEQQHRLGRALLDRFRRTGAPGDLSAAIEAARLAADAVPGNGTYQWLLGAALCARFDVTQAPADLDEVVEANRRAVAAATPGHPDHAGFLGNLAGALNTRFERTGDAADLDEAIAAFQTAGFWYNAGVLLVTRFRRTGDVADLDLAIEACRRALTTRDGPAHHVLGNLAVALRSRFDQTGDAGDLEAAIEAGGESLARTPADDRGTPLTNLGISLLDRFGVTGGREDLERALALSEEAVRAVPPGRPERAAALNNLSLALLRRHETDGASGDIERAVSVGREAVDATPPGDPERPARMSNLALALRLRFELRRSSADLDAAVEMGTQAVGAVPAGHPRRATLLSDLGTAHHVRYRRTGDFHDLQAAVEAFQDAVDAMPAGRPFRAGVLHNLGVALRDRFTLTGDVSDLDRAIRAGREAVNATPPGSPTRSIFLATLAEAHGDRSRATGAPDDLHAAVAVARKAVEATPDGSPQRAVHVAFLGNALRALAERSGEGAGEALAAYRSALGDPSGPLDLRISAARAAADLVHDTRPALAADLLESAVALLPETIPAGPSWSDRQHELKTYARLAADAAALALSVPSALPPRRRDGSEPPALRALRLLESGRSILLGRIRQSPPLPGLAELCAAAEDGPIVVFNVSRYRSDAILLTPDGVDHLPLPDLAAAPERFHAFLTALRGADDPEAGWRERVAAQDDINATLEWLWDAAAAPVLDALGCPAPPPDSGTPLPRVWWVPGGMLSVFPLHAAGHHRAADGRTALDRVVSSYAPTVRALLDARRPPPAAGARGAGRALVVAMPQTPGAAPLPYAAEEAELLRGALPGSLVLTSPARDAVLAAMADAPIAHFACHGVSEALDPARSRLLLADHETAPLTVADLAAAGLSAAELVYLSACSTAQMNVVTLGTVELAQPARTELPHLAALVGRLNRGRDLLDEAITLAAAFQAIGVRHVVGTLWEIDDAVTLELAGAFYQGLRTENGALDLGRSAEALHRAVRAVRDRFPQTPSLWAPYLHAGA
ncbi:CHAT domain-containing protein [Microbispora sp. NEAU-D428]|uniref:CHAT domain-containing protein n=1 Tax=Microbispora sitophila TaxID=2771537 RepID=UPI001868FC17|nr:CHAT domain-containing protein [Microbispora sitophila]MBE3012980.1 CHAT domain-containing protein [Microbispora sitophila]